MAASEQIESAGGRDPALSGLVALIGAWFVATAFIWNRTTAGRIHAIAVGLACVLVAQATRRRPAARWLLVPLALWLFLSAWIIPYERHFAVWNNVAIGIALLLIPPTAAMSARSERAARA